MLLLFSAATGFSALLLFYVQPMMAKELLPLLGGAPAAWNAAMMSFQALLLAGYAYAHLGARKLNLSVQAYLHLTLLALSLWFLPPYIATGATPSLSHPALWAAGALLAAVGLPFFLLSATAPMLQHWFSQTSHPLRHNPYLLYVASNVGSLIALLSYPILVEPNLSLTQQKEWWSGLYAGLALIIAATAWIAWQRRSRSQSIATQAQPAASPPQWKSRVRWVALAFIPSSMMLGLTQHITTDVSPVPLFWTVPLALYLITFILAFLDWPRLIKISLYFHGVLVVIAAAIFSLEITVDSIQVNIAIHLACFFAAAMICHGRLAATRPPARYLTEFYFFLSLGGVLGGIFNTLIAPLLFTEIVEYPLMLALSCLARPRARKVPPLREWARIKEGTVTVAPYLIWAVALGTAVMLAEWYLRSSVTEIYTYLTSAGWFNAQIRGFAEHRPFSASMVPYYVYILLALLLVLPFMNRRVTLALGVAALLMSGLREDRKDSGTILFSDRNFFGVYRVTDTGGQHRLVHGTTLHAMQYPSDPFRPVAYYHRSSPIGHVFEAFGQRLLNGRIAAIGLGAGAVSCLASHSMAFTFFEIDPLVEKIARDPRYFTYMRDCPPREKTVVLGDARLSLERDKSRYRLIIVDAFSSDAIPVHLLTREAVALYLSRLEEGGAIALHITNRHLELRPIIANIAVDLGLVAGYRKDLGNGRDQFASRWVVLVRRQEDLGALRFDRRWMMLLPDPSSPLWTDDYSNIFQVLR